MTGTITKPVTWIAQLLASVTMLIVTMGMLSASALTMNEAFTAYERGDYATALVGFWNYAEQGDAHAQFNLGIMYASGQGVPEDDAEAVRWYRLAAEQGGAKAQAALGAMYAQGQGVPEDAVSAYAWFSVAAAQGNSNAQGAKEYITRQMTRAQIAEAQKLSREYWAHYVVPFQ